MILPEEIIYDEARVAGLSEVGAKRLARNILVRLRRDAEARAAAAFIGEDPILQRAYMTNPLFRTSVDTVCQVLAPGIFGERRLTQQEAAERVRLIASLGKQSDEIMRKRVE